MEADQSSSILSIDSVSEVERRRTRDRKTSSVVSHCRSPGEGQASYDTSKRKLYYCKHCPNYVTCNTTNFRHHLRQRHSIDCPVDLTNRTAVETNLKTLYDKLKVEHATKDFDSELYKKAIDLAAFRECLVNLVVVRSLPLSIVEWDEFHILCRSLNPEFSRNEIPLSHNTLASWIKTSFCEKKDVVRRTLQSAISRIHLSVDVWTSPNKCLVAAICSHFVDTDEQLQTVLLGVRHIGGHAGEIQFEQALLPVLEDYEIVRRIGAIVGDNATTNDTLCRTISQHLRERYPRDPEWIPTHQRIRCLGHILHLAVQAFLFPDEAGLEFLDSYDRQEELEGDIEQLDSRGSKIRTILGPLGKLHNIVVHIRSSPLRTAEFMAQAKRRIPLDNRTRWNSWFQMLDTIFHEDVALDLESVVQKYCQVHVSELSNDILDTREWIQLRTIHNFLGCFSSATLTAEGHEATLEHVLDNMDTCWMFLEEQKVYCASHIRLVRHLFLLRKRSINVQKKESS